ncbi:hypothetical protein [uncultured Serinicoccus sp.]|uniref:hypothetical protein n=1 Tax=uncultured Serinicoccus sp. TaxID=735514 RepID=UPI0026029015|nr:hypothetical protein [uncultured Serinicoccus sp.]
MSIIRARVLRLGALALPLTVSAALLLVLVSLPVPWGNAVLTGVVLVALWGLTGVGEVAVVRALTFASRTKLHQRHILAGVARVLRDCGVDPVQLLVARRGGVCARAYGQWTVVVGRSLIEEVARGRLPCADAAALIAHEVGVQRVGLTRADAALGVILLPWELVAGAMIGLWQALGAALAPWIRWASLTIAFGIQIWLTVTGDARHLAPALLLGAIFATYGLSLAWSRARADMGDTYLTQHGLGPTYAAILWRSFPDDRSRDRAVRLLHAPAPQPCGPSPVPATLRSGL